MLQCWSGGCGYAGLGLQKSVAIGLQDIRMYVRTCVGTELLVCSIRMYVRMYMYVSRYVCMYMSRCRSVGHAYVRRYSDVMRLIIRSLIDTCSDYSLIRRNSFLKNTVD